MNDKYISKAKKNLPDPREWEPDYIKIPVFEDIEDTSIDAGGESSIMPKEVVVVEFKKEYFNKGITLWSVCRT